MKNRTKHINAENYEKKKEYAQIFGAIEDLNGNGRKTIAIFCDTYYPIIDGVIQAVDNEAICLSKYYNVVVVVPAHEGKPYIDKHYLTIGIKCVYFDFLKYDCAFPLQDNKLKKLLDALKIDLIQIHSPFNVGAYAVKLAYKRKIPVLGYFHSQYKQDLFKATKSKVLTDFLLANIISVYNKCHLVFTMNKFAEKILRSYNYRGEIKIIRAGIDFNGQNDVTDLVQTLKDTYNIEKDCKVLMFLGRIVQQKNVFLIVEALEILNRTYSNFKMFFIGAGPELNKLKKIVDNSSIKDKVYVVGKIEEEEKHGFYALSDLFLFPSVYDTEGIVKSEAAYYGTPTIAFLGTGAGASIKHGFNGYLCENDVTEFAKSIEYLLRNDDIREEIGENAKNTLFYTWEQSSNDLKIVYDDFLENFVFEKPKLNKKQPKSKTGYQ